MTPPKPREGGQGWPNMLLAPEATTPEKAPEDEAAGRQAVNVELVRPLWVPLAASKRPRGDEGAHHSTPPPRMARCFQGITPWKVQL